MDYRGITEILLKHGRTRATESFGGGNGEPSETGGLFGFDIFALCRLAAAAIPFAAGMIFSVSGKTETVLMIMAAVIAGYDVLIGAVTELIKKRSISENLLMSVASAAAFVIGEGHEGAAVMILFQTGDMFRQYAVRKAKASVAEFLRDSADEEENENSDKNRAGQKAESEKFIAGFARTYTPAVLLLSVALTFINTAVFQLGFSEGISRALVFLVVACPCALVISIPLAYFAGIGGASRIGILFKSSAAVDACAKAKLLVFDKSALLTADKLRVSSVKSETMDADMLLRIAAHTEAHSGHVMARAIKAAYDGPIFSDAVAGFREFPGAGVTVKMNGTDIFIGSRDFISDKTEEMPAEDAPERSVFMSAGGKYVGRITFAETVEEGAAEAIREISDAGCEYIAMVSADSSEPDGALALTLGADEYFLGCPPEEKAAKVREIKSRYEPAAGGIIFAGRGADDVLAIEEADIGIGFSGGLTNDAVRAADIVITGSDSAKIAKAVRLSKNTRRILLQNVFFVLGVKTAVLVLGAFGISPLWFAVLADTGVTVPAVLNSLRAFFVDTTGPETEE